MVAHAQSQHNGPLTALSWLSFRPARKRSPSPSGKLAGILLITHTLVVYYLPINPYSNLFILHICYFGWGGTLSKIISGGQTGADRAALDAGIEADCPIGGSCPAGRLAEDGSISNVYKLTEIEGRYRQRNKRNVADSDGTAIFYSSYLTGGTEATVLFCIRQKKPYKLIDIELTGPDRPAEILNRFIGHFGISILNVAGPRASGCPGIYDHVKQSILLVLRGT